MPQQRHLQRRFDRRVPLDFLAPQRRLLTRVVWPQALYPLQMEISP